MNLKSDKWSETLNKVDAKLEALGFSMKEFNTQDRRKNSKRKESKDSTGLFEAVYSNGSTELALYSSDDSQKSLEAFVGFEANGAFVPVVGIDLGTAKDWDNQLQVIDKGDFCFAINNAIDKLENLITILKDKQMVDTTQQVLDQCLNFFRSLSSSTISDYLIESKQETCLQAFIRLATGLFTGKGLVKANGRKLKQSPITQLRRKLQVTDELLSYLE